MFLFIRFCGAVCNEGRRGNGFWEIQNKLFEAADLAAYVLCMEITGTRYRAMVNSPQYPSNAMKLFKFRLAVYCRPPGQLDMPLWHWLLIFVKVGRISRQIMAKIYYEYRIYSFQLITAALHTLSICLICVLPESPRWLIVNNRVDEAERYIRRACREPPFPFNFFNFNKSSLPCDLELVWMAKSESKSNFAISSR